MGIITNLDVLMLRKKISLKALAKRIGITPANLSNLKTDKAKSIRFSTLEALCRELECQPGDILEYVEDKKGKDKIEIRKEKVWDYYLDI